MKCLRLMWRLLRLEGFQSAVAMMDSGVEGAGRALITEHHKTGRLLVATLRWFGLGRDGTLNPVVKVRSWS